MFRFFVSISGVVACFAGASSGSCDTGEQGGSCPGFRKDHVLLQMQSPSVSRQRRCETVSAGHSCYPHVSWARYYGIDINPSEYPGLTAESTFEDFQHLLHQQGQHGCPDPCGHASPSPVPPPPTPHTSPSLPGYPTTASVEGAGKWCEVAVPPSHWALKTCSGGRDLSIKVLSYNLFWWNLFGRRGGNGGSAGRLIAEHGPPDSPYDIMGFQECDNAWWPLDDSGMRADYDVLNGGNALAIVYRKSTWVVLGSGSTDVSEDRPEQWYGTRGVQWARLQHQTSGKIVFAANHHGALPINTGGKCGGKATAFNIMKVVAENAHDGDVIVVLGDFNANEHSSMIQELDARLNRVFSGWAISGIDHFYTNCNETSVELTKNLGTGGSDHHALHIILKI